MALPGREKTFTLENCRDLLRKLEREIDRFSEATDVEGRIDCAFSAVVTAWHLCDCFFADFTPDQKAKLQINTLSDLQAEARQCRALHLCQQAANASKHWKVSKYRDPDVGVIVTAEPIGDDQVADPRGWCLYFVDRSGIQSAKAVFESALEFWTQFIFQNEIAKNDSSVALKDIPAT